MARELGISPSLFSQTMNGKAHFSDRTALAISTVLGHDSTESDYFCSLVQLEKPHNAQVREKILDRINRFHSSKKRIIHDLDIDTYKHLSDWYYSAILELVFLDGFVFSTKNIARRIGISELQTEVAVDRLQRLGLLRQRVDGSWERLHSNLHFKATTKSLALVDFYRQMLNKISLAFETQDKNERLSRYETIPIASEALPQIREAMQRFFEEVLQINAQFQKKEHVYHLVTHFFNLTHPLNKSSKKGIRKERL